MSSSGRNPVVGLAVAVATAWAPGLAHGYTVESAATEGCHERITSEALRRVRETNEAAAPISPDDDERAMIGDLQFTPEEDMRDLGAITLLLAVRDNDLKGRGADDLSSLALVHGNPDTQDEHCLRALDDDEPEGSARAIAACRAFMEKRVAQAIAALDAEGRPSGRTKLAIHLAIRGDLEPPLPTFYVRMGQALHALEDGFSHTYRTEDGRTVTVALNWLDVVGGEHVESRDGPAHSSALDACDDADDLRTLRRELATDAATELLHAALAPGRTDEEKMQDVRTVLDTYFGFQPGCTAEDGWCDAAEARIPEPGCGCATPGSDTPGGSAPAAALGGALGLAIVARRSRRRSLARPAVAATALAVALTAASPARAQPVPETGAPPPTSPSSTPPPPPPSGAPATVTTAVIPGSAPDAPPTTATQVVTPGSVTTTVTAPRVPDEKAPPPPVIVPVEEPGPTDPSATTWGFAVTGGGSVDKPGFAGALGLRLRVSKSWAFGLDGEWNPWLSLTGGELVRSGAVNIYGSAFWRLPLAYEKFNIRSSLSLGTSTLLTDLYGAPSGSTGLFIGAKPLSVEYKAADWFYLVISPLGIDIPIPQISGLPFLYPQYRLSLAVEFYAG